MITPATPSSLTMPPVGAPPSPKSKLSSAALLVLVVVAVLVLGGIGVLVAQGVKSEPTPTKPPPVASPSGQARGGEGRSARSAAPSGNAGSNGTNAKTVTTVKLAGGAATQPVPSGWTAKAGDSGNSVVVYKAGFFAYTEVAKSDAEATAQVNGMLTAWVVDDDHYSQVRVSDPTVLDASAPFSSGANIGYVGLYTSNGGSSSVYGVMIAFVRTDGLAIRLQLEAFSATSTDDALARFKAQNTDFGKIVSVIDSFAQSAT